MYCGVVNIAWVNPIFDRVQSDVDHARATRNYYDQLKGAQGYIAWNRLTGNMYYLADLLKEQGHNIELTCRRDWDRFCIPRVHEIQQIKDDLALLRYHLKAMMNYSWSEWNGFGKSWAEVDERKRRAQDYFSTLPLPELPWFHFEKINNVEEITFILNEIIDSIKYMYRVSGTFTSGQISYLPHFVALGKEFMSWMEWNALGRTWTSIDAEGRTAANFFRRM